MRARLHLAVLSLLAALCACQHRAPLPAVTTFKVAAVQFTSQMGAAAENRRRLAGFIRAAASHQAKIVVLPEVAITGYMSPDLLTTWHLPGWPLSLGLSGLSPRGVAETVPGPSTHELGQLARELGIYLTVPIVEVDLKSDRFFNTVVLVDPQGRPVLHYRKLNPWPFAEQSWATPGDRGHQYLDTLYGRLALLICYDINFEPQLLVRSRVDLLLYSIAWVDVPDSNWFSRRLPAIASANDLQIIGANWTVPTTPQWHGYGHSLVLDRRGQVRVKTTDDHREEVLYADLAFP